MSSGARQAARRNGLPLPLNELAVVAVALPPSPSLCCICLAHHFGDDYKKEERGRDGRCSRSERAPTPRKEEEEKEEKEGEKGRNDFQTCNLFASSFIGDDDASFSFCHASHFRVMYFEIVTGGRRRDREATCDQTLDSH